MFLLTLDGGKRGGAGSLKASAGAGSMCMRMSGTGEREKALEGCEVRERGRGWTMLGRMVPINVSTARQGCCAVHVQYIIFVLLCSVVFRFVC